MPKFSVSELAKRAAAELTKAWSASPPETGWESQVPPEIQQAVLKSINSKTKSYRYVLPTQVLAKLVDSDLDSRSLQEGSGLSGSFDARSLCHEVIVPFDRKYHNVLGGSPEPYVNNPLRVASLTAAYRSAQRNKGGFDDLCEVVEFLEAQPTHAQLLAHCVLATIRSRLESVQITYPVPNRASLKQTQSVICSFLSERTGGVRLQAVSVALFRSIGEKLRLFDRVEAARIIAADAATGSVADLSCSDRDGQVLLAVEVKDRVLQVRHVQDKLPAVREQGVRELLSVITGGIADEDAESLSQLIDREFITGQNVYVATFDRFLDSCLVLFGEAGRRDFLTRVGKAIDDIKADLVHRQAWRDQLARL